MEEPQTDVVFKGLYLMTDGRLADVQFTCCLGERTQANAGLENAQGFQGGRLRIGVLVSFGSPGQYHAHRKK